MQLGICDYDCIFLLVRGLHIVCCPCMALLFVEYRSEASTVVGGHLMKTQTSTTSMKET